MKAPIRASLLAAILALTVAAPVFADPGSSTHESTTTCRVDDFTGFTYCFESEADIRTKEKKSGASDTRTSGTIHSTVVDAEGNLVSSYDLAMRSHDVTLLADDGSAQVMKVNIRVSEEITDGGVTSCTQTHVVVRGGTERVTHVTTEPGAC